jgi:hypothetical protein
LRAVWSKATAWFTAANFRLTIGLSCGRGGLRQDHRLGRWGRRIGQATARRAHGFGMRVLYWAAAQPEIERESPMEYVELDRYWRSPISFQFTRRCAGHLPSD